MPLFLQPTIFSRSACLSGRTGRAAHRGFTLIEVLVALALAAEFMAVVPGPPAQPSPVYLISAGQGS